MKKLLALLLAMVMIFALAACAGDSALQDDDDSDDKPNQKKVTPVEGEWTAKIVIDENVIKMDSIEGMEFDLEMVMVAQFNSDYTYEMAIDEEALKVSAEKFIEDITASMVDMLYNQYEQMGLSREQAEAAVQQAFGMSLEEYCKNAMKEVSVDDFLAEHKDDFEESGTYRIEGDQLYLLKTADDDEKPEEETYTFKIEGNKLSLSGEDEDFKELLEKLSLTELVFTAK